MRDGTLVSTASILRGDAQPFDVETVTLHIRSEATIFSANYGVTDRFDISAAAPIVRVTLSGQRVDTYRGRSFVQATGPPRPSVWETWCSRRSTISSDRVERSRRRRRSQASDRQPRQPARGRPSQLETLSDGIDRRRTARSSRGRRILVPWRGRGARLRRRVDVCGVAQVTLVGEAYGRRLTDFDRLADTTLPHPTLAGVSTIRLSSLTETRDRIVAVGGIKWNIAGTWLLTANLLHPLGDVGLNAKWMPVVTLDYSYR